MRTLIAIPCMDQIAAPFAHSLSMLEKEGEVFVGMEISSLIYEARNSFAKKAINTKVDFVLWLDSDMVFSADLLKRMLRHMEEGKDIVSGIYFRRRPPFSPVLFKKLSHELLENGKKWEGYDDYPKDSVFEIDGAGFGCMMIRTSVLLDMALNCANWFEPQEGFGEDLSFCLRAKELGYKIFCDSSIKCGHIGQLTVDESVWEGSRT